MKLLSIIIPAFNADRWLHRCLKSITEQSDEDVEIIVVDDGSLDETYAIASSFESVIVFKKFNGGVSSARNFGIEKSTGKWLMFIDSDDYLLDGAIDEIRNSISANPEVDCHVFGCYYQDRAQRLSKQFCNGQSMIVSTVDAIKLFVDGSISNSPFSKVFLRTIGERLQFAEGITVGEDALFAVELFLAAQLVEVHLSAFYVYAHNAASITNSRFTRRKLNDIMFVFDRIAQICDCYVDRRAVSLMVYRQTVRYVVNSGFLWYSLSREASLIFFRIGDFGINHLNGAKMQAAFVLLYIAHLVRKRLFGWGA